MVNKLQEEYSKQKDEVQQVKVHEKRDLHTLSQSSSLGSVRLSLSVYLSILLIGLGGKEQFVVEHL